MKVYPIRQKQDQQKFELFLKSTNSRNYVLWTIGSNTGLRIADLLKLTVSDVQGSFLEVVEQKTGKKKRIKLNSKVKAALTTYLKELKKDSKLADFGKQVLFPSRQGRPNTAISTRTAQRIIKSVAEKLGIEDNISTHSMRKTYAWNIYKASGNNIALVMEALNHSKESITLRYLCLLETMIDDVTELIAAV
ncbi:MAG: tyrosine-type recombinase/integrase [Paraclostridium sp.]